jgi:hypothetical protein
MTTNTNAPSTRTGTRCAGPCRPGTRPRRGVPWPGTFYMSPQMRAELGIPDLPLPKDREPLPPHLDESSPDFQPPRCLHPSMLSEQARARVQAHEAAVADADADATITAALDADLAAWEPEAEQ